MANNGESKIKTNLEADLVMKDSGTIDAMLNKVKALHAEINGLQKSMDKAMGARSAESGLAKQLQELTANMRVMVQQMNSLGHASATSGQGGKLLVGATAAGQLQGLKDLRTAEEKLYQQRILNGNYSAKALLQETDARKQKLALDALELKAAMGAGARERTRAERALTALRGEIQLRKEVAEQLRASKAKAKKDDIQEMNRLHGLAIKEDKRLNEVAKRNQERDDGLRVGYGTGKNKLRASVAAEEVMYGSRVSEKNGTGHIVARAVAAAQRKIDSADVTTGLHAQAKAAKDLNKTQIENLDLVGAIHHHRLSNIRLGLAGTEAEQKAEYATRLAIQARITALKEEAKLKEQATKRAQDVSNKLAAPEVFETERRKQTVVRQMATTADIARASNEKLIPTLANVAKATDLVWLQEEKRYAGIRKGMGGEDVKKEEQARINAISARIKALDLEAKARDKVTTATTETTKSIQARLISDGRLKMSQYDSVSGAALLEGKAKNIPNSLLQRLEQGQKARQMAGVGRGDEEQIKDAQKLLDLIEKIRAKKQQTAAQDRADAREKAKAKDDSAKGVLARDAEHRQELNYGAIIRDRNDRDAARAFKQKEAERIQELALQGLKIDGINKLSSINQVNDQLAASRHRARAAQSQQERDDEGKLQGLLRLRSAEIARLHRQDKPIESPAEREKRLDIARGNTRDRLFGDGGANTLIVQAGLMANYQVLGGLQNLLSGAASSAIEFDKALKQVQAVSAATRNEMVDLRQSLIEVAQSSRFSAAEVAQASVLLAQAGLSVKEIQQAMAATIALATASGSELKKSVDVMTSVLSVFDMGADKSTDVANKLTAALNMSKLDIDKMALGLQYAGNAAADAGVTFNELVSTLSAMANAGIRSGSTLGTGTRQLFVELQKPSENFKRVLDRLGIGMSQIDIKAQGFEGVLRNLQEAGFTTGDAFQSFQIRAASSFAALSNNINVFHDMQDAIDGTNAALEANEIQMESLAVQYDHLKSNLGIVAAEGFAPVLAATRDTVKALAHFFEGAEKGSSNLKVAFTALAGAATAVATAVSLNMLVGLVRLSGGMGTLLTITRLSTWATLSWAAALSSARLASYGAAAGYGVLAGILKLLSFTPVLLGIGLMVTAFGAFGKESEKLKNKLDEARTALNSFVELNSKSQQTIENVDEAINTLASRYGRLSENSQELDGYVKELANQFRDQGLTIENLAGKSIEQLIETLGRLRTELSDDYIINIREEGKAEVEALKLSAQEKLAKAREQAAVLPAVSSTRVSPVTGKDILGRRGQVNFVPLSPEEQLRGVVKAIAAAGDDSKRLKEAIKNFGYQDEGEVNSRLSDILANPKLLPKSRDYYVFLDQILRQNQNGRGVGARVDVSKKNAAVDEQREKLTAAAHLDANSGYQMATRMTSSLSLENKRNPETGASLEYLRENAKLVDAKLEDLKKQRKAIENSLNVQDMAKYQALGDEETAVAKLKSTYAQQMEPLIKEEKLQLEDKAKYELEDAEKKVKRIEKQITDEKNINLLTDGMADKLAAARRELGQKRIEALVAEMTRAKASPARIAMAKARLEKEIQHELDKATPYLNDAKDALIKENKDFDQKLGKDALTAPFKEIDKQLDNFDTNLKGLLDERSGSVSAKVRQLKQRIQDNRLAGAGIATSGDLYGPKALGRNNDLADLSFRRRAGAQFRSAALGKELQKAQVEEAKIKVSAIDAELPKLEAIQKTHEDKLSYLEVSRDKAKMELDALIAQQTKAEEDKTSLSPAFADKKKQAYEDWKVMADVYDAQEKQANNIKDKIYGLEDTKGNLLETLGNQEGKFQMWLDALKTGIEGLTQSFSDMFQRIVTGTGDTEEAFREMGRGILASMLKVISDKIAQKFMEMITGTIGDLIFGPTGTAASPEVAGMTATASFGPNSRNGGPIHRRAGGGYVPGSVARDAVPTLLMPGEFVLQKSASAALGEDFLHGLNRTTGATMRQGAERAAKAAAPTAKGEPSSVNVWVVTPDQQTGMSKDDIIVTVGDNIARNGSIRKLIKQVQVGG